MHQNYKIYPLGDAAACIDLGNVIDEEISKKIIAIREWLRLNSFEGLKDIVIAYSSISIYYDPIMIKRKNHFRSTVFKFISDKLESAFHQSILLDEGNRAITRIPVCYSSDFGIDLDFISKEKNISKREIIHLHTSKIYRVYLIGFLPGFSYLGKIDERISISRKPKPISIAAGSVGIAGMQTGIYPLTSPGGWQIIGRTPIKLFDPIATIPVIMNAGDHVQFYEISKDEFENYSETNRAKIEE